MRQNGSFFLSYKHSHYLLLEHDSHIAFAVVVFRIFRTHVRYKIRLELPLTTFTENRHFLAQQIANSGQAYWKSVFQRIAYVEAIQR